MIITLSSLKGGVGKSTFLIFLGNCLAARGKKVLVVDLDPNNSTTMYYTLGLDNIEEVCLEKNIFSALNNRQAENYIINTNKENISIIPSSIRLPDIRTIDPKALSKTLSTVKDNFDFILIDTAPTYDNHTMSAIHSADIIFTPLELTTFNMTTSRYLREKIMDELEDKYQCWYLVYGHWQSQFETLPNSKQMQFAKLFESMFENILEGVHIPHTTYVDNYTQVGEKVAINSKKSEGAKKLAVSYNQLANLLEGYEIDDTSKYVEAF